MTCEDEDLIWHLCIKAARLLEDGTRGASAPPQHFEDVLAALELLSRRTGTAAKLVTAPLALTER